MRGAQRVHDREKVLLVPTHRAGVSYFGLASVQTGRTWQPLAEWQKDFFYEIKPGATLESIASRLADELNRVVSSDVGETEPSGLHLAGFEGGRPEFWLVRSVDDHGEPTFGEYAAGEDFQRRDLVDFPDDRYWIYRNGDLRVHERIWTAIDTALAPLLGREGFRALEAPDDYCSWVRSKMEVLARFYEARSEVPIIGLPVDAFAISPLN